MAQLQHPGMAYFQDFGSLSLGPGDVKWCKNLSMHINLHSREKTDYSAELQLLVTLIRIDCSYGG
jgi:hypothetical protein